MQKKRRILWLLPFVLGAVALSSICRLPQNAGAYPSVPLRETASAQTHQTIPDAQPSAQQTGSLPTTLFLNSHEQRTVQPEDKLIFRFTPDSSDEYIFRSFPVEGVEHALLDAKLIRESDRQIIMSSQGEGVYLIASLDKEESYQLELIASGEGGFALEVMQQARGRCFDNPIALPDESIRYAKTIVRPRDVHYFSFTAPVSGWYSIRSEKTGSSMLDTLGFLMDSSGKMIAMNDDILFPGDPNFMIQQQLTAGKTYLIRISAMSNQTGAYRLVVTMPQEGQVLSESVTLPQRELTMDVDQSVRLQASVAPADALSEIVYVSSDSGIVSVEPDGTLTALKAGTVSIWAFSYNGVKDSCVVTVRPVKAVGMEFAAEKLEMRMGEELTVKPVFSPAHASDQSVQYTSSDESVLKVSRSGVLTALEKGTAVVTAVSNDGGFTDTIEISVQGVRPVYRALVIGEQQYEGGVRMGGENTARGVADMLKRQKIDGESYEVRLQLDSTRRELLEGIREAFDGAKDTDISLLYINCHGAYENGTAYLRLHDETHITVDQLEQMLRDISGKVVVILDFCQSGSFIGAGGEFDRFSAQAQKAFSGGTAFTNGKYTVIASASADEDSYRRSFTRSSDEQSTAAIMGRSLCEGAGWDLIYDRSVTLKADRDRDQLITVQEIYEYSKRRVNHYLEGSGVTQTVHLYPAGDQTVIFGKTE